MAGIGSDWRASGAGESSLNLAGRGAAVSVDLVSIITVLGVRAVNDIAISALVDALVRAVDLSTCA